MNPPRAFISYSHDSAEHKKWILDFATTLRRRGIDAVLDQWDLKPGDDLPHFMETQLESADFVLMICTDKYVEKANAGEGGVGYEKMIMTASLLSKIDSSKVIPIIRQSETDTRPTFMKTKIYIDFSNDENIEYSLDDLLRVLLQAPLYEKPEIGTNPFEPLEGARPDRTSDGVKEVMTAVAECFDRTSSQYIMFGNLMSGMTMRRLTVDRYVNEAIQQGLIERYGEDALRMTPKGLDYLATQGIIDA